MPSQNHHPTCNRQTGAFPERVRMPSARDADGCAQREKEISDEIERADLDFRLESRGRDILEFKGQVDRPAQPDLVDRRGAYRIFGLADLEHRRHQIAGGRLPLHHRRIVSAGRDPRPDRLADALSLHVCGDDIRRPQLDHLQRFGALHPDPWSGLFRQPARYAVLADVAGRFDRGSGRRQLCLQHGQYLLLLSRSHEGMGTRPQRGGRQYRRQQRSIAHADPDGCRSDQSLSGHAGRRGLSAERRLDVDRSAHHRGVRRGLSS